MYLSSKIAVILAAGIGTRLQPLTLNIPKCLVKVGGLPILEHQLRAYEAAGIEEVHIVTGFRSDVVAQWIKKRANHCRVIITENTIFDSTNNMYSLFLLRNRLKGQSFLLSNGDVVFSPAIVHSITSSQFEGSAVAADRSIFMAESMKIISDPASNQLSGISKTYSQAEALAVSIDLYLFSAVGSEQIFESMAHFITERDECHLWSEVALHRVLSKGGHDFRPHFVDGEPWVEIDDLNDLSVADITFSPVRKAMASVGAFVFDIDGTLMIDRRALPGVADLVTRLRQSYRVFFCTNNSALSRCEHAAALIAEGIPCKPDEIITSYDSTCNYLREHQFSSLYVVGTDSLKNDFTQANFDCETIEPDCVVVGFDMSLTYGKIAKATQLIAKGCPYILTHPDPACPTAQGPVPDAGALGALITSTTGIVPQAIMGKPQTDMLRHVTKITGLKPSEIAMIGDRLATDIRMAKNFGCLSILVLSGVTTRQDVDCDDLQPDLIIDSVASLETIWTPPKML